MRSLCQSCVGFRRHKAGEENDKKGLRQCAKLQDLVGGDCDCYGGKIKSIPTSWASHNRLSVITENIQPHHRSSVLRGRLGNKHATDKVGGVVRE